MVGVFLFQLLSSDNIHQEPVTVCECASLCDSHSAGERLHINYASIVVVTTVFATRNH